MMRTDILLKLTLPLAAVSFAVQSAAQNLDPTVEVNRAYEGKLIEVHKPALDMAVPDSVMRFDLDFDYSVFESPYKGSYEFNPYLTAMKPLTSSDRSKKFWLRAGAGYTLHPTFDLVWSPAFRNGFKMDVYGFHRSFIGDYRKIGVADDGRLVQKRNAEGKKEWWSGYDLFSRAGVDGRYDWDKGAFDFDFGYYGVAQDDWRRKREYDAFDMKMRVASKKSVTDGFVYDAGISYRFGEDKMNFAESGKSYLGEHLFGFDVGLGAAFRGNHRLLFDMGMDMAAYSGEFHASAAGLHFVPHYVFDKGRWHVDAGLRISVLMGNDDTGRGMYSSKGQYVYPDVTVRFAAIPDAMMIYAVVGGGDKPGTYSSVLAGNRHYDVSYGGLDNVVERVSAIFGVEGRISTRFSYDIRGGYVNYASSMLDAVVLDVPGERIDVAGNVDEAVLLPGCGYASWQKAFAALDWNWKAESIRFDGNVTYTHSWGKAFDIGSGGWFLRPSVLRGDAEFVYDWKDRIFIGADCEFATARRGEMLHKSGVKSREVRIPGWVDLGVYFEYALNRKLSFWARGGNLLDMAVQRSPLYVEKGVSGTVGISLSL